MPEETKTEERSDIQINDSGIHLPSNPTTACDTSVESNAGNIVQSSEIYETKTSYVESGLEYIAHKDSNA